MSRPHYQITQESFDAARCRPTSMTGVPGELLEDDRFYWWKPPAPEAAGLRALPAEQAQPYRRLPLHGVHLPAAGRAQADTAAVLGALPDEARAAFSQEIPLHCTFWPKESRSGDYLMIPKEAGRFLPSIVPIILTERANLPHPALWPYVKFMVRTDAGIVEPQQNVRVLDRADSGKKAVGYNWHKHVEPIKGEGKILLLGEYLVADTLPTIVSDDYRVLAAGDHAGDDAMVEQRHGWNAKTRAVTRPATSLPCHVNLISGLSAHNTLKNESETPVFRNFMRVFTRISERDLNAAMRAHPEIIPAIRQARPDLLQVSSLLR